MSTPEGRGSAILSSPRPAPGPLLLSDGPSIALYVCTEWANECMQEWMNKKLRTSRKETEQQMQKQLRELLVRHPFSPSDPVGRRSSVKGQCQRCRPPQTFSPALHPHPCCTEWQGWATHPLQPMSQEKISVQTTYSRKNPRSKGALGPKRPVQDP